ncbi:TIGR03986 family CRISPR-associated RAMP protein [Thermoanaerobacterium sp. RBIITD]|uniref:TIGR03986 family type III CRISPR-associated RAMP protein n=1 Tax=Thermoanaerobacterium sp. RBIITD TaxID=1550240 RepID=UPI000BB77158|nr:TIGR03986 family CRISPR-associated RAMP protein [Thermoanaerobacterium sp. RBIITD]SNX52842.1 CRISPR-associated protein [Thermoanaerobacterium sp. RBIITD]
MKPEIIEKKKLGQYAVAPYNFVSFPKKAVVKYKKIEELPAHNDFKGLSGYVEYTLKAETPIIVSTGVKDKQVHFFINTNGKYAIPGNTIRGIARTNCQILSFSNIIGEKDKEGNYENSEIENSRFLYRDIAGNNSLSARYKSILGVDVTRRIAKNVKAGYIVNRANKYYIEPAKELKVGVPYFRIDEIILRRIASNKNIDGINFMYKKDLLNCEVELKEIKREIAKNKDNKSKERELNSKLKSILKDLSNERIYKPYQTGISFEFDSKTGRIIDINRKGILSQNGYLLSGGFILGKLSHYIVPEADDKSGNIKILREDIEAYKDDLIRTKKMNNKEEIFKGKEFFALPKKNERKPVFYINTDRLHFGFTPYLRIYYTKTVLDGVSQLYKDTKDVSYTDGIFGFSKKLKRDDGEDKNFNYKSRVSFEDAEVVGEPVLDEDSVMTIILAEPKPTSYNLYLKQDKDADKKLLKIYEDDFKIRGFKQYWLKDYIEKPELEDAKAEEMKFTIHPLKEGTIFKGRIYFTNLDEEELGLLGWALKLNDGCYQNIGLAKPYGFGRVKVEKVKLYIEDLNKKYDYFSFDYFNEDDLDKYINIYKRNFSDKYLNGQDIENIDTIKEFMLIKSKVIKIKDANNYRYMELNEFRNKKALPEILKYEEAFLENNIKRSKKSGNVAKKDSYSKIDRNYKNSNTAIADAFRKAEENKNKKKRK